MFGVLRGSTCKTRSEQRQEWQGHLCGLCLSLRDNYGHPARLATNYDAAVLSVLCAAQADQPQKTYNSNCPLRRNRQATITAPDTVGAQYAAAVSLVMAAAKIQDHVADGETVWRYLPNVANAVSGSWLKRAKKQMARLNFDTHKILEQTQRQVELEAKLQQDFYVYSQPTELAVGAAFRHTAVLVHKPHNQEPLFQMGRMFGRIMYLLDSVQDLASDVANDLFNPLINCYEEAAILAKANEIFQEAHATLLHHFALLDMPNPQLAHALFHHQLKTRVEKTILVEATAVALSHGDGEDIDELKEEEKRKKSRRNRQQADRCNFLYCYGGDSRGCGDGCDCGDCTGCDFPDCGDSDGGCCDTPDCGDSCDGDGADCGGCDGLDCDADCG